MDSIEWTHVPSNRAVLYGPYDPLGDNQCAAEDGSPNDMALAVGNCAIWGTKTDLIEFLEDAVQAVTEFDFPEDPMRAALEKKAEAIIADQETALQRESSEFYIDGSKAIIIVPGEEGLYPGMLIAVDVDGTIMQTETGSWGMVG